MNLALGTAQFGSNYGIANVDGQVMESDVAAILDEARRRNVTMIDTAIAYGQSEMVLGKAGVSDFQIVSKIPPVPDQPGAVAPLIASQIAGSLDLLRVDQLHAVLLHNADDLATPLGEEIHAALLDARNAGLVSKIGVSIYHPRQLARIPAGFEVDLVQAPANLLDRRVLEAGLAGERDGREVEFHFRSIFLQGLLVMDDASRPETFSRWEPVWRCLNELVRDLQRSRLELCVRYMVSQYPDSKYVVGVDGVRQFRQLLDLVELGPLPQPEFEHIRTSIDRASGLCPDMLHLVDPSQWSRV